MTYQVHVHFRGLEPLSNTEYTIPGVLAESAGVIIERHLYEALRHFNQSIQLELDDRIITIEPERRPTHPVGARPRPAGQSRAQSRTT